MRIRLSLALALMCTMLPASGSTSAPLGHHGRWLTDTTGRAVILHGVNVVNKLPPYAPDATGFGDDDAALLAAEGFNSARLGIIYKALEPVHDGTFDDAYLERIAQTAHVLGLHGIRSIVDFHQDLFNETFNGEGFPDWAVRDDGLPHQPDGGFPANYFAMPALWRAYDNFYANVDGLQESYAAAWAHAAARLSQEPAVAGYDVFNEPWPGSVWPTCLNPAGCPLFDAALSGIFAKIFATIRTVDPDRLVYYETHPIFAGGADVSIPDTGDGGAGFSFHAYCLGATVGLPSEVLGPASCPLGEDRPFDRAEAQASRTDDTLMLSEFGATDDLTTIARDVDAADRHMDSWEYWTWYGKDPCCDRPQEGIIIDPSQPPSPGNLKQGKLDTLVRPYPRATAGTPVSFNFDPSTHTFDFVYDLDSSIAAPTEIVVPARQYSGGYTVTVAGPAAVTSAAGAAVLTLDGTGAGVVHVTITP